MRYYLRGFIVSVFIIGALQSAKAQQQVRLNDNWEFLKQDLGGVWEAVRPVTPGNPESLPIWSNVTLPHCFNARDAVDPDVNYYQGPGWYRTRLLIDNPYKNGRTLLHFEGAGQNTSVYIYNIFVGTHKGGYDEWTVDITQAVADFKKTEIFAKQYKGKIPVEIRCDNSRDLESIPSQLSDFNVYGGIYRYLNLVYAPQISIDKVFATASIDTKGLNGKLDIKGRFYNPLHQAIPDCSVSLFDAAGKKIKELSSRSANSDTDQVLGTIQVKNPKLWSPVNPTLYTLKTTYTVNGQSFTHTEKIGFRSFNFAENGPFYLNGKRLLLRGTHRHEDHSGVGAAMTEEITRQEMKLIKEMGANFIRLGHYQQSRIVLNLCDSLGLLVWEEEPWCRGGLGGTAYRNEATQMLTNMIEQHYNHPAIILWGLGNENDWEGDFPMFDKEAIRSFMKEQNNLAHKLDPTRKTTIRRCDFCRDIPDVYSPTIWAGWYKGSYTQYKEFSKAEAKKVPRFFHAEWGGDSHAGRHSEDLDDQPAGTIIPLKYAPGDTSKKSIKKITAATDGDWSETYICNLFDWHLKEQETMPWLSGSAFWAFKDFSTPLRPDNPVPYVNQKGVVESDLTKKEVYYLVQSYWSDKPMAHIYGHSWPVRWGKAGEAKMVKVYSNCTEAELFVNNKSYGVKKRNSQDFPAAGLRWMVPFNTGQNQLRVVAHTAKMTVTDTITQGYQTAVWSKPQQIVIKRLKSSAGIATVEVQLADSKNIPCLDAANWINFSLSGDGTLLDDLGNSHGSRKVQAYNGRAVISLKLNDGKSVIGVKSPGLETIFLEVK